MHYFIIDSFIIDVVLVVIFIVLMSCNVVTLDNFCPVTLQLTPVVQNGLRRFSLPMAFQSRRGGGGGPSLNLLKMLLKSAEDLFLSDSQLHTHSIGELLNWGVKIKVFAHCLNNQAPQGRGPCLSSPPPKKKRRSQVSTVLEPPRK